MSVNDASRAIWEQDKRHFLHPWTNFEGFAEEGSLVIQSGDGAHVTDANGQRYLDAVGGLWCTQIGLGRDEMADAIAHQVRELAFASTFTDLTNGPAAKLAAKIASLAPGDLNRVAFTTGGSTAIDTAYRTMQFYHACNGNPDKIHVIARKQAYHGSTYAAMSIGNKATDRAPEFRYIEDTIHHISCPDPYRAPDGLKGQAFLDYLVAELEDKIAEVGPERVGGFFMEPIMGAGGVVVPPEGYFKAMAAVCRRHGILVVADEVVTAFGRLGAWFSSYDVFGVVPDMICCAKGITSGYLPLGAMIYSDAMHDVMATGDPDRWYTNGFTYSGHPVCCAAALKNIEIMEREGLVDAAQTNGLYFEQRLKELEDLRIVGEVRGKLMMQCVENVMDKNTREQFPDEVDIGKRISNAAEARGLIVRPIAALNVMSPPLTISRDEIDFVVDTLRASIEAVTADLLKEGHLV